MVRHFPVKSTIPYLMTVNISILSWDNTVLNQLLIEAKKAYFAAQENNISIYVSDSNNGWRHIASRPKRPLKSIVLDPGIKDRLIDDAQDFLASKRWYSSRGIPFRRGYLLVRFRIALLGVSLTNLNLVWCPWFWKNQHHPQPRWGTWSRCLRDLFV